MAPENIASALGWLILAVPAGYLATALLTRGSRTERTARFASAFGLGAALSAAIAALGVAEQLPLSARALEPSLGVLAPSVRLDAVTLVLLGLVTFIAHILVRFSARYLEGEPGRDRYFRWLMATLAAVTVLVSTSNLLWLGAAWVATSLSLHQLLTFYRSRPRALIAAHKKFLVSRVADVCLWTGLGLLAWAAGSPQLDDVYRWAEQVQTMPAAVQVAGVLFVLGAALKCAQLPFHGWLTQVMEAPTPVSALLHAGVVNIGGVLMIRLAPVMIQLDVAQTLLVVVGTTTAVLAALVMTTQSSVKVSLAWSTSAQMGFMLVQCGLGAYSLALLHLVAHSLYKAQAFLGSGTAVERWRASSLLAYAPPISMTRWVVAALFSLTAVAAAGLAFGLTVDEHPALWALGTVLALALTPLVASHGSGSGRTARERLVAVPLVFGVAALYFAWHGAFETLVEVHPASDASLLGPGIVVVAFVTLFTIQAWMNAFPDGRLVRAMYPRLYAGLYLDELFTRATFRIWPAKMPPRTFGVAVPKTLNPQRN